MSNSNETGCEPGDLKTVTVDISILQNFVAPKAVGSYPVWEIAIKIAFYILAMTLDIFGNSVVILIIVLNRKMRTTTNTLIANLAFSDLMVACFCMWVHAGNQVTPNWPFGNFFCKVNTFFQVLAVTESVLTLMVIAVERFYAVVFPFKGHWSSVVTGSVIAATWVVAIATASPQLAVRREFEIQWLDRRDIWCAEDWPEYYVDTECNTEAPGKRIYYIVEALVMYFLPIVVMVFTYSMIAFRLLCRKHAGNAHADGKLSHQDRAKRKVTKMLVIVLCVFIVCWTPQQVLLLNAAIDQRSNDPPYMETLNYIALYMAYFSSAINPILYAGFNENFRRGFLEAFKCILMQRRNRIDPDTTVSPSQIQRNRVNRGPDAHSISAAHVLPPPSAPPAYTGPQTECCDLQGDTPVCTELTIQTGNGNGNHTVQDSAYGSVPSDEPIHTEINGQTHDVATVPEKVKDNPMENIDSQI